MPHLLCQAELRPPVRMWTESSNAHIFEDTLQLGCSQLAEGETAGYSCCKDVDGDASALARVSSAAVTKMVYQ